MMQCRLLLPHHPFQKTKFTHGPIASFLGAGRPRTAAGVQVLHLGGFTWHGTTVGGIDVHYSASQTVPAALPVLLHLPVLAGRTFMLISRKKAGHHVVS